MATVVNKFHSVFTRKMSIINSVSSISDRILNGYNEPAQAPVQAKAGHSVKRFHEKNHHASLKLQIVLFLNVYFTIIWVLSSVVILYIKFELISTMHQILSVLALTLALPIECLRLFLGYSGNLLDKIPDFAGFWILSVFIQFPIQLYLTFSPATLTTTLTIAVQTCQLAMLIAQILISFPEIRKASLRRAEKFHLEQLMKLHEQRQDDH